MGLFRANNSVANFWMQFATLSAYVVVASEVDLGTDSVLIKFVKEFDICGVFELFSMKIKIESAQN